MNINSEIEIRHLRYFLAVAETLHFGKAAKKLGIAQPPLSQQIKNLERMLGYSLFDRTTRGVKLTTVGQFFAERGLNILSKMQDDVDMTRRLGAGKEGMLNVGFSGSVMLTALPEAIEAYRRVRPNVELRLRELVTAEQIPALLDGTLAIGFLRDGEPREGLLLESIVQEPYIAVLPSRHRLARRKTLSPVDLRGEPFVLFSRRMGNLAYDRTIACCEAAGFRPNIVQDAPQWPTVLRLVAAGLGVSMAPVCVGNLMMPGITYRRLRSPHWSSIDIGVRSDLQNPAAEIFLQIVRPILKRQGRSKIR
jgi:DNA-binding transcriptional LysR family regulator